MLGGLLDLAPCRARGGWHVARLRRLARARRGGGPPDVLSAAAVDHYDLVHLGGLLAALAAAARFCLQLLGGLRFCFGGRLGVVVADRGRWVRSTPTSASVPMRAHILDLKQQGCGHSDGRLRIVALSPAAEGEQAVEGLPPRVGHALQGGHVGIRLPEPLGITLRTVGRLHEKCDRAPVNAVRQRQLAPLPVRVLVSRHVKDGHAPRGERIDDTARHGGVALRGEADARRLHGLGRGDDLGGGLAVLRGCPSLPFLSSAPWNMTPTRSFMGVGPLASSRSSAAAAASESSERYGSSTRAWCPKGTVFLPSPLPRRVSHDGCAI